MYNDWSRLFGGCHEKETAPCGSRLFLPIRGLQSWKLFTTVSDLDVMLSSMCAMMMGDVVVGVVVWLTKFRLTADLYLQLHRILIQY